MWQPEHPSSQTVARGLLISVAHRSFPPAPGQIGQELTVFGHFGDGPSFVRQRARWGRPGRTCRSRCSESESPQGWFRSVIISRIGPASHDVPGVRAFDFIADADAARAEDAAIVVEAEPLVAGVDGQGGDSGRGSECGRCPKMRPESAVRSGRWRRKLRRSGCVRRSSISTIIWRYSTGAAGCRCALTIPSCAAGDTQAGRQLAAPSISTRHSRHAPTSDSPSRVAEASEYESLFSRATAKMVSSPDALTILAVDLQCIDDSCEDLLGLAGHAGTLPGGTAFFADMRLVLLREISERAEDRVGRGLAQPAEAGASAPVAELFEQFQVVVVALSPVVILLSRMSCICAVPTRQGMHLPQDSSMQNSMKKRATSTMQEVSSITIMPPDPMIEPTWRKRLVIDGHVEELLGDAAAGGPAGLHGFELLPIGNAAADVEDDLAQRSMPIGTSISPVLLTLPARAKTLVPLLFSVPMPANHSPPSLDNRRDVGEGFDVVDQRGAAPEARLPRGIGRARPRLPALAFDRGDQRRLFAADERAGPKAQIEC